MRIEKAESTDYLDLIEIWEASINATHDFLNKEDVVYFKKRILEEYFDLVDLFVFKNNEDRILGFLGISQDKVEMLFVHPNNMGKGIGRMLLNFAVMENGVTKVDVNEQNPKAVGFYKAMGFEIIRRNDLDAEGKPYPILEMELK